MTSGNVSRISRFYYYQLVLNIKGEYLYLINFNFISVDPEIEIFD